MHGSSFVDWGNDRSPSSCWRGSDTQAQRYSKESGNYCRMNIDTYQVKKEENKSCGNIYYGIISNLNKDAFPINGENGGYWYIYIGQHIE